MNPKPETVAMIKKLISFDTTSRNSNLELIAFVQEYLTSHGATSELVYDDERTKANLYATLGPDDRPGIALSGHTDVVPVDGQNWNSDPFDVIERDGYLYGRGTSDMKSFVAVCLVLAPEFLKRPIETPLNLVFSYDEEIGCLGVRGLIKELSTREIKPKACIIGEPTSMTVVRAHKGKLSYRCHVHGLEGHSGMAHLGVNAVEFAAEAIARLKMIARRFRDHGPFDPDLTPPYTTVHTGVVHGGTQLNIIPKDCWFDVEIRHMPGENVDLIYDEVKQYIDQELLPEMHAVSKDTGFTWHLHSRAPALNTAEDAEVVQLAKALTGRNDTGKVSFATEAGLFDEAKIPSVICGPGSIEQAHKPNEFISLDQIAQCETFVRKLFERCWKA